MQTIYYAGSMLLAAMIAGLIIAVEHYFPWRLLLGKQLPSRPVCYALGLLAILGPYTALIAVWALTISAPLYLTAVALWTVVAASGLSTVGCYALDAFLLNRAQVGELKTREAALKENLLGYLEAENVPTDE